MKRFILIILSSLLVCFIGAWTCMIVICLLGFSTKVAAHFGLAAAISGLVAGPQLYTAYEERKKKAEETKLKESIESVMKNTQPITKNLQRLKMVKKSEEAKLK